MLASITEAQYNKKRILLDLQGLFALAYNELHREGCGSINERPHEP
jgi:hypothetical protein